MSRYSSSLDLPGAVAEVFAFFTRPANLLALAPRELQATLVEAPEILQIGAHITWQLRRWGMRQTIIYEVTTLVENVLVVLEQRQGPLALWTQQLHFEAISGGTRLREEIEYEPPRGLLGRLVTEAAVRQDLDSLGAYRARQLGTLYGPGSPS
jgi:ligand-binding SRPBCC domain-containing protein